MVRFAAFVTRRARWLLLAWITVAVLLTVLAPSLQKVATQDAAAFLPKDVPSEVAERASRDAFPNDPVRDAAIIVFERDRGALTTADRAFIRAQTVFLRAPAQSASVGVGVVQSAATQPDLAPFLRATDRRADLLIVSFRQTSFSPATVGTIARIRDHLASGRPAGLSTHVTGFAGLAADQVSAVETSFKRTAVITVALVLLILLLIYRSPVAALVPLVTIGVSFLVARAVVALIAEGGLSVSGQAETFMVVMVFGAGTDYCLFLVSRYRELRADPGASGLSALQRSLGLAGPVVVASGATVIVGFGSQAAANSGLYETMGPAIAIAIAITVLASLTLTPALLALLGGHAFWPQRAATAGRTEASPRWQRRAARVAAQPLVLLIAGTILLQLPAAGLGWFKQSFDLVAELPSSADAKVGYGALARHYPPGVVSPVFVIVSTDASLLTDPSIKAIDTLTARLAATPGVAQVRSVSLPAAVPLTQSSLPTLLGKPPQSKGNRRAHQRPRSALIRTKSTSSRCTTPSPRQAACT
jgi:RND superfamily putative drug exporter